MSLQPSEHLDSDCLPIVRAGTLEKGRVLLLEDDETFKDVVRDFLTESGYTVVAVANGREGVLELLDGDFAMIVCDMAMPKMPGDMFYRAAKQIRPLLCERFAFYDRFSL